MPDTTTTIAERIRAGFNRLTRAERQLANALMANYPVAGLTSITELAKTAATNAAAVRTSSFLWSSNVVSLGTSSEFLGWALARWEATTRTSGCGE